jgi:hypothetical protein
MTAATLAALTVVAAETEGHSGAHPLVWGGGAFVILMLLLLGTLAFGRGRS